MLYGVQIATARREADQDLPRLLGSLERMGLTEVELHSSVFHYPAAALRRMIEDAGLRAPAAHFALSGMEANLDYARELGLTYMVVMLPRPGPQSLDQFHAAADRLNEAGAQVRSHGMRLSLLFHNRELMPQEGSSGFRELVKHTDPANLSLEADLYWIAQAGLDPAAFLAEHGLRVTLLHLKDRLPGFPFSYTADSASDHSTELGRGTIPWPAVLGEARRRDIRYAFLDYDKTAGPILDSLKESVGYLKTLAL